MSRNALKLILFASIAASMTGCATIDEPGGEIYNRLKPADAFTQPVQCLNDCKVEWQRAQLWVGRHSMWKIQLATDSIIQTFYPRLSEVSYGFTVTKEPTATGGQIQMDLTCGNALGCDPSPAGIVKSFYFYVSTGQDLLVGLPYTGSIR